MKRYFFLVCIVGLIFTTSLLSQVISEKHTGRPVSTYSIVAIDSVAGEMGVAVQSHWFSVGSAVPWAKAGVGVVATQSFTDIDYGPLGLQLMEGGRTAPQALRALTSTDPHQDVRQVAMLDVKGNIAAHTGARCISEAGHIKGQTYSVQANLMEKSTVWPAMAEAFENTDGDLAGRMLSALDTAQAEGGDIRGKQSAAMLIVKTEPEGPGWQNVVLDLRVEDHQEPLVELRRLLRLHRAYIHMNNGDMAMERGNVESALREYSAAEAMFPDNLEMKFWHAVSLVNGDRTEDAIDLFRVIFREDEHWAELLPRLVDGGHIQASKSEVREILKAVQ